MYIYIVDFKYVINMFNSRQKRLTNQLMTARWQLANFLYQTQWIYCRFTYFCIYLYTIYCFRLTFVSFRNKSYQTHICLLSSLLRCAAYQFTITFRKVKALSEKKLRSRTTSAWASKLLRLEKVSYWQKFYRINQKRLDFH